LNNKNKLTIAITLALLAGVASFALYNALNSKPIPTTSTASKVINTEIVDLVRPADTSSTDDTLKKFPAIQKILNTTHVGELQALLDNFLSGLEEEQLIEVAYFFSEADIEPARFASINLTVIEYWTKKSPTNALSFSQTHFYKALKSQAIDRVLLTKCFGKEDIKECISDLPYSEEIEMRLLTISEIAHSKNNYSKALIWADAIQNAELKLSTINRITKDWISNDAEQAFQWAALREPFIETAKAAINQIVETDPWQAYTLVTQITDVNFAELRSKMYTKIVNTLVASGDYLTVMSILESASQHETIASVARKWIDADPKSALEWALNYEDLHSLGLRAIDELTKKDHQTAFEIASLITNDRRDLRKDMFTSIFSDRAYQEDYSSIMQMLKQLPRGEAAENYYDIFITQWADSEPELAIEAILSLPTNDTKATFIVDALEIWSEQAPLKAAKELNTLNNELERTSAITGLISGWGKHDANGMFEWLSTQASSPELDGSIAQASNNLVSKQPDKELAIKLTNRISDEALRTKTLEKIQSHVYSEPDYN